MLGSHPSKPTVQLSSIMTIERSPNTSSRFTCKFCTKGFVNESRYLQHECQQMKRDAELRSPVGQAALNYYQLWMRAMKRMPPPASSFATSRYFRTFVNFVNWTHRVHLPKVDKYIWLMVQKEFPPMMWMNPESYSLFLEYLDRDMDGYESAKLSIKTLFTYADRYEIPVNEVFEHMTIEDVIQLLQLRKLSPWLLLHSRTFKKAFVEKARPEQRVILESLIRPEYWPDKMAEHPSHVANIKLMIGEMGI